MLRHGSAIRTGGRRRGRLGRRPRRPPWRTPYKRSGGGVIGLVMRYYFCYPRAPRARTLCHYRRKPIAMLTYASERYTQQLETPGISENTRKTATMSNRSGELVVVAAQEGGRFAGRQRERARGLRGCERAINRARAFARRRRAGGRRGGRGVAWDGRHAAAVSAP